MDKKDFQISSSDRHILMTRVYSFVCVCAYYYYYYEPEEEQEEDDGHDPLFYSFWFGSTWLPTRLDRFGIVHNQSVSQSPLVYFLFLLNQLRVDWQWCNTLCSRCLSVGKSRRRRRRRRQSGSWQGTRNEEGRTDEDKEKGDTLGTTRTLLLLINSSPTTYYAHTCTRAHIHSSK